MTLFPIEQEDDIDRGPTYSSDSEAATEEAEPAAAGALTLDADKSAQQSGSEPTCYPQRKRQRPTEIYKAQAATAIELGEPRTLVLSSVLLCDSQQVVGPHIAF